MGFDCDVRLQAQNEKQISLHTYHDSDAHIDSPKLNPLINLGFICILLQIHPEEKEKHEVVAQINQHVIKINNKLLRASTN